MVVIYNILLFKFLNIYICFQIRSFVMFVQSHNKFLQVVAIIITPTRELAVQISDVTSLFLEKMPNFTKKLLIGGNNPAADVESITNTGYLLQYTVSI